MKHPAVAFANSLLVIVAAAGLCACTATNPPARGENRPVNRVEVSHRLITSGQPSVAQIAALEPLEFRLVINLAPTDDNAELQDEARMLGNKGIAYAAIPVDVHQPDYRAFVLFSGILNAVKTDRVWVHCRVNNRASVFTFLYRVIHEGADPDTAYEKVTQVWVPAPNWLQFARETLAKHNIAYDF